MEQRVSEFLQDLIESISSVVDFEEDGKKVVLSEVNFISQFIRNNGRFWETNEELLQLSFESGKAVAGLDRNQELFNDDLDDVLKESINEMVRLINYYVNDKKFDEDESVEEASEEE